MPTIPPFYCLLQLATHQSWCNHPPATTAPTHISELTTAVATAEATGHPPPRLQLATAAATGHSRGHRPQPQPSSTATSTGHSYPDSRGNWLLRQPRQLATGHIRGHQPQLQPQATATPTAKATRHPQMPRHLATHNSSGGWLQPRQLDTPIAAAMTTP